MTWSKFGSEFPDQLGAAGLSDAAFRMHVEAIMWLYRVNREDVKDTSVPKGMLRRIAGSDQADVAVKDLVAAGLWLDEGDHWTVEHHADVVAASLVAQRKQRDRNKKAQAAHRNRQAARSAADVARDVSADVSDDADRQTDSQAVPTGELKDSSEEEAAARFLVTADDTDDTYRYRRSNTDPWA